MSNAPNTRRMQARLIALQTIYAYNYNPIPQKAHLDYAAHEGVMEEAYEEWQTGYDKKFLNNLLEGTKTRQTFIDDMLIKNAALHGRDYHKFDTMLRALLALGTEEIISNLAGKHNITINAWLDIGHSYYDQQTIALINAILDTITRELNDDEDDE